MVPDSYAGVFPPGTQGPLIYDFGACTIASLFLSEDLVKVCNSKELTIQEMMKELMTANHLIPYGYIQVKNTLIIISNLYIIIRKLTI